MSGRDGGDDVRHDLSEHGRARKAVAAQAGGEDQAFRCSNLLDDGEESSVSRSLALWPIAPGRPGL